MFKFFSRRGRQAPTKPDIAVTESLQDVQHLFDTLALDSKKYQKFELRNIPEPEKEHQATKELTPPLTEEENAHPSIGGLGNAFVSPKAYLFSAPGDIKSARTEVVEKANQDSRFKWVAKLQSNWSPIESKDALVVGFASYSGGVGKSTLCAALSSSLRVQHYHCLVLGQTQFSPLPFYLGVQDPFDVDTDDTITHHSLTLPNTQGSLNLIIANRTDIDLVSQARSIHSHADLILYDFEASSEISSAFEFLDLLLVPLRPDINGLIIINRIEQAVSKLTSPPERGVYYVLNQYDETKPIHREIRSALKNRIRERLLDIVVPLDDSVQEALASGALPETYRSDAPFVAAIQKLSIWLRDITRLPMRL